MSFNPGGTSKSVFDYHTTRDQVHVRIMDMTESHLSNTIGLYVRPLLKRIERFEELQNRQADDSLGYRWSVADHNPDTEETILRDVRLTLDMLMPYITMLYIYNSIAQVDGLRLLLGWKPLFDVTEFITEFSTEEED